MKKALLMGSLLAVLFVSCDKDDEDENSTNDTDRNFVMQASMGNRAEISAGQLAATKGANANVRTFGQMMVTEHTTAQNDLRTRATSSGTSANYMDTLDNQHRAMMQTLNTLTGRAFDSAYMAMQVMDHQATINLYQTQISNGRNANLKNYATQYLPGVQRHLATADSIRTRL